MLYENRSVYYASMSISVGQGIIAISRRNIIMEAFNTLTTTIMIHVLSIPKEDRLLSITP